VNVLCARPLTHSRFGRQGVVSVKVHPLAQRADVELDANDMEAAYRSAEDAVRGCGFTVKSRCSGDNKEVLMLLVEGMTCASCVGRVERGILSIPGVENADVSLATGRAKVSLDPSISGIRIVVDTLGDMGYPSRPAPEVRCLPALCRSGVFFYAFPDLWTLGDVRYPLRLGCKFLRIHGISFDAVE
jgi:copper chaperone CopZ